MEPGYPPGSRVLVWRTRRVRPGDVIAFRLNNDPANVLIKRVTHRNDDESVTVAGDNPGDSLAVGPVCRPEIIGKVVLSY
jgi:phage repressor protein C with HTH and peptisase S24 domain